MLINYKMKRNSFKEKYMNYKLKINNNYNKDKKQLKI